MPNEDDPQLVAYREAVALIRGLTAAQYGPVMQELKALYDAPGTTDDEVERYVLKMAISPTTGHRVVKDIESAINNFDRSQQS